MLWLWLGQCSPSHWNVSEFGWYYYYYRSDCFFLQVFSSLKKPSLFSLSVVKMLWYLFMHGTRAFRKLWMDEDVECFWLFFFKENSIYFYTEEVSKSRHSCSEVFSLCSPQYCLYFSCGTSSKAKLKHLLQIHTSITKLLL